MILERKERMLYHLALYLQPYWHALNVVHYVSFRVMGAFLTTLFFSFATGNSFIAMSKRLFRSKARERLPERHRQKDNLPTMGGIFILSMIFLNTLLWCDLSKVNVWLMLLSMAGFGTIGAWDDWQKIRTHKGVSGAKKFAWQCVVTSLILLLWYASGTMQTSVTIPFIKWLQPDLGIAFMVWAAFIIIGTSNAVNLTDGLDGLAIGSLLPNFATFSVLCYLVGNARFAAYLNIPFAGTAEIALIGAILVAASLGFLWYNAYPAQIFMGDVGSLALGAALGLMALLSKQELLLAVAGGVFVAETISVILQIGSYRVRGKKIFRMAPMHHHFELLGWPEAKITVRFAIISLVLCMLALITIKIR